MKTKARRFGAWQAILVCICLSPIIGGAADAVADDLLIKQFLDEAPKAWREYHSSLKNFDLQINTVIESFSKKDKDIEHEAYRAVCGEDSRWALFEFQRLQKNQKQTINTYVNNPDYEFELRKKAVAKSEYSIHEVMPFDPQHMNSSQFNAEFEIKQLYYAFPLDFRKIVNLSSFQLKNATETIQDGNRFVRIEFEYNWNNPGPKETLLVGLYTGSALFAPDSYWALIESKIKLHDDPSGEVGEIKVEHQIGNLFEDLPVLQESKTSWYNLKGKLFQQHHQELSMEKIRRR